MSPSFYPRLINDSFGDPGVYVPFAFERRSVVFDLGDLHSLSNRDILKISHGFVTHTHVDHFIGFDILLRLFLGRDKTVYLYGPEGFLSHVEGKLSGYSWNLVGNYSNRFEICATEVRPDCLLTKTYRCAEKFDSSGPCVESPFAGTLLKEPALTVSAEILDHRIPTLGFSLQERFHVNILKTALAEMGLSVGPWLKQFKEALYEGRSGESIFEIPGNGGHFQLKALAEAIARVSPGQKITYITDVAYTESNREKILALAGGADYLFIESAFLERDSEIARQKYHLTARQAGMLAGRAGVREFTLFHFSPRYEDCAFLMRREAEAAYRDAFPNR